MSFRQTFNSLMFGEGGRGLTDAQKDNLEWKRRFSEFTAEIDGLKPLPGESELRFFERKGGALAGAIVVVPAGVERDRVLGQYVAFLRQSSVQADNPADWYAQVDGLASLTQSLNPGEYRKMLDALEHSGHPVMTLYARLAQLH